MMKVDYFSGLGNKTEFNRDELLNSFRQGGYKLSDVSFYKQVETMVSSGEIIRVGKNRYCLPNENKQVYRPEYSKLGKEVAMMIQEQFPYMAFSVFELVQMNDFVNHLIGYNVIFLSVDAASMDFVFDSLKEKYPGRVLINPSVAMFHKYWIDNMIVIVKLVTEAPKGAEEKWHVRLEKILVDLISDSLLLSLISESEYSKIYGDACENYYIDENSLFRYASRRKKVDKIRSLIHK
ncbi:MAG: hypothetical protein HUJ56_01320 [Erysipelotrichaceae bacterium]|nr:hypothetical protein [Erysipelotrichaceae bacterium]